MQRKSTKRQKKIYVDTWIAKKLFGFSYFLLWEKFSMNILNSLVARDMVPYRSEISLNIFRYYKQTVHTYTAVFRICDILVRIRILLSRQWHKRHQQKFFSPVFMLIPFWKYIYIILKYEKVIKQSQNSINQAFSYYIARWWKIRISIRISRRTDPDRPKIYRSGTLLYSIVGMVIQSWRE